MSDTPLISLDNGSGWQAGNLLGRVHHFKTGEGLPLHEHTEENNHITIVLSGRFRLYGRPAIEGVIIKAGDVLDWVTGEPHAFEALEDSSFVQIRRMMRRD